MARTAVLCLLALLAFAGCGDDSDPTAAPKPTVTPPADLLSAHVEGAVFRDTAGRQVLLRGFNARVEGIFDVTFDDGRIALEEIPPFDEADAQRFEELGLNVLRLPVNWSGLEPQPLHYSEAYMQRIDAVLELARRHHFYVLIDMHQDAYSKEFGEDGAPLWAIVPPPPELLQGPLTDLEQRRLSPAVLDAFGSFFSNDEAADGRPLQDAFAAAVLQLVRRYRGHPAVIGYQALNEPIIFVDALLDTFHANIADAVHSVDPTAAIFFEPFALRNQTDRARIPAHPWSHGPGVYAPHIYTQIFSPPNDGWKSENVAALAPSMENAAAEAAAWGTPLFVGEYGTDQTAERGHRWLEAEMDLQDRFLASGTVWVWRETGDWGLIDGSGLERPLTARTVSRPFPRAVAGDVLAIERPAPGNLRVRYLATAAVRGASNEVSVSATNLTGIEVRCDGVLVTPSLAPGRASFACSPQLGEHVFDVTGVPRP